MNKSETASQAILKFNGWTVFKTGLPDFFCVNPISKKYMFVEVKQKASGLSRDQKEVFDWMRNLGIPAYLGFPTTKGTLELAMMNDSGILKIDELSSDKRTWWLGLSDSEVLRKIGEAKIVH